MKRRNIFNNTDSVHPGRSAFDNSYFRLFNCDMGQLIPVLVDEVVPGDIVTIGNESVTRMQPLVAPILHEVNQFVHYFFVPNRILLASGEWEKFITGSELDENGEIIEQPLPEFDSEDETDFEKYTLWDYFGFPTGFTTVGGLPATRPTLFPWLAYNRVFNEYYRDNNLQEEVAEDQNQILYRNWEKDYFTSALPWQQRGIAPALPITGSTFADFTNAVFEDSTTATLPVGMAPTGNPGNDSLFASAVGYNEVLRDTFNKNVIDFASASTFDVSDLRTAFQVQKWLERNARGGVRYTEWLKSHFGISPRDERLQRPEYIGGSKAPLIVSEVLQTSQTEETGTPQGNMSGHGLSVTQNFVGKYRVSEYGVIIGIMSIMPKPAYQQGLPRQWLRKTKYDFFFPEFVNLSEQAIQKCEIFLSENDQTEDESIFGFTGRYDEMRIKQNMVCGDMRDTFSYWHLGRLFETSPELNEAFIVCNPSKRIFAVQDEPGFLVNFGNLLKMVRPLPSTSIPGLIDHN